MYKVLIRRSIIGREKDVLKFISYKAKDGDQSYIIREGLLRDFLEDDEFGKLDFSQKLLNICGSPVDVGLDKISRYFRSVDADLGLMNLIDLQEPGNRVIFIIGYRNCIKIHSGELTSRQDQIIQRKFLLISLELMFGLKLNELNPSKIDRYLYS